MVFNNVFHIDIVQCIIVQQHLRDAIVEDGQGIMDERSNREESMVKSIHTV